MAGFFGKAKDELIYKTDAEIADHDFILPCISSDKKALESEVPITFVEKLGDRIYETTKFKMPLRNGEFGIGGIMHDITNRISSEKALEESRLELKAIYDNAPVMMCVIDEQTNILFQNKEFTDFVNLVDEEKEVNLLGEYWDVLSRFKIIPFVEKEGMWLMSITGSYCNYAPNRNRAEKFRISDPIVEIWVFTMSTCWVLLPLYILPVKRRYCSPCTILPTEKKQRKHFKK